MQEDFQTALRLDKLTVMLDHCTSPHDVQVERMLLGLMLVCIEDADDRDQAIDIQWLRENVQLEHFHDPVHRVLFRLIRPQLDREQDTRTGLEAIMRHRQEIEQAAGQPAAYVVARLLLDLNGPACGHLTRVRDYVSHLGALLNYRDAMLNAYSDLEFYYDQWREFESQGGARFS